MKKKSILLFLLATILFLFPRVASAASNTPLYRLYHPDLRVHLYTKDKNEYTVLGKRGWNQEGLAWVTANSEGDTVFRLYHPGLKVHLYTKDKNEYQVLATRGWQQEGTAFYSEGSLPIYRLYHTGMKKHLYTKDENEYQVLATRGWKQEGIAFYGLTSETQKVTTETVKTTEGIPFKTITKDDKNLYKDETKVQTKGINGSIETTYKVTYIDGIETKRIKIKETKKDPIDEIILKGTKDRIVTKTETKREELKYETIIIQDNLMLKGEQKIKTKGENGFYERTYEITYTNGIETGRKVVKELRKEPVNEEVLEGTINQRIYTEEVKWYESDYKEITTEFIEDSTVNYGSLKVLNEGNKAFYTVTVRSVPGGETNTTKVLTPAQNRVLGMHPGDVVLDVQNELTLFKYLSTTTEEERFVNGLAGIGQTLPEFVSEKDVQIIKSQINMELVNKYFIEFVNSERVLKGKDIVSYTEYGMQVAGQRAQELADFGGNLTDGTRPDGSDWKTLDINGTVKFEYSSHISTLSRSLVSEKYIAYSFYRDWWRGYVNGSSLEEFSNVSLGIGLAKGSRPYYYPKYWTKDNNGFTGIIVAIAE